MSNDMMKFPETWEEFENDYGRIYDGIRVVPSFRVKQWLEHIEHEYAEDRKADCEECLYKIVYDEENF